MPAKSVDEINITNFVNTGSTRPMARYTFSLEIKWTDFENVQHIYGPAPHDFPADLATMPLNVRRKFAEEMIKAQVRVTLGLDTWDDYA